MEVILLQKVRNLGDLGDRVKVRPGFGRNMLIPNGMALPATPRNIEIFEQRRAELEKAAGDSLSAAQSRAARLQGVTVTIKARSEEGKLYGSVGPYEIVEALRQKGIEIEKREIQLHGGPIRTVGEQEIALVLHSDVEVVIKVQVEGEEREAKES